MIEEKAHAKLNLALDVVGKREDGYHELKMIMIPLALHDVLTFSPHPDIVVECDVEIPDNHVLKTIETMKRTFHVDQGVHVTLTKHIPIGAGLGGGSANIAATIRGLNRLWQLDQPLETLENIALELGSDTLFCLYERPAFIYGRGDQYLFIDMPPIKEIELFSCDQAVSTKTVFAAYRGRHRPKRFERLFRLYLNEHYQAFFRKTYNALLKTTMKAYPAVKAHYKRLKKDHPTVRMTGSGSTFFVLDGDDISTKKPKRNEKNTTKGLKTRPKS